MLYQARHRVGGFAPQARLRLQHARPADLASGERCLLDLLEQARAARRLLARARAAEADDVAPPQQGISPTRETTLTELTARVTKASKALIAAHKALDTLVKKSPAADAESLRTALLKLSMFGLAGAVPAVASGDDASTRATLSMQATALLKEAKARVTADAALAATPASSDPAVRRGRLLERLRAVFGGAFVALPLFKPEGAADLGSAIAQSSAAQGSDALAVHTWFARCSRVRDTLTGLADVLRGAEVLATGERLDLKVAQLPFKAGERWVGLPLEPGAALPAGKVSLVLQVPVALDPALAVGGLMVDEWVELVPSRSETTALAFQYDPPDSSAPQSVLLAVPPVVGQAWTVEGLHRVLVETFDMAKLRGIDVEALGELAHYLPALFFAFNDKNDVVATDFAALTK